MDIHPIHPPPCIRPCSNVYNHTSQVNWLYQVYYCFPNSHSDVLQLQASLRESWLDDMMHVLEGEALGQDAATVEAAFKRHEAIGTDVKARVSVKIL